MNHIKLLLVRLNECMFNIKVKYYEKSMNWLYDRFPLPAICRRHFSEYYLAKNLNFWYVFGSIALVILFNQLVSGIWLNMFYIPDSQSAFDSVQSLMRDVNYGWLLRYMHSTGASALFIVMYLHLFRGILYGSYQNPRELVWILGMCLYYLLIITSLCGYLLPWGQMSYWGAQVIISLISGLPYLGELVGNLIRGDYSISGITLRRFYTMHIIVIPMLLFVITYLHISALHYVGSNNPNGEKNNKNKTDDLKGMIPFYPFYVLKDCIAITVFLILFFAIVFFFPNFNGIFLDSNNFIPADPLFTPDHIAPMWYISPFYAILRAVPHKLIGIIITVMALLLLVFIPWLDRSPVRPLKYKGIISKLMTALGVGAFIYLGYLGLIPVSSQRLAHARECIIIYFAYFILMPWYTRYEFSLNKYQ